MGIDHRRSDVGMAQQRLDRADVVVGLQEMGGKTVTERVRLNPLGEFGSPGRHFNRLLNMRVMQMVSSEFFGARNWSEALLGKEPLPNEIFGRAGYFFSRAWSRNTPE